MFLPWLQSFVLRIQVRKKSSHGTQGNIIHGFEGMQSRVSINSSVGLNLNKYLIKLVLGRLMYVSNDGIGM